MLFTKDVGIHQCTDRAKVGILKMLRYCHLDIDQFPTTYFQWRVILLNSDYRNARCVWAMACNYGALPKYTLGNTLESTGQTLVNGFWVYMTCVNKFSAVRAVWSNSDIVLWWAAETADDRWVWQVAATETISDNLLRKQRWPGSLTMDRPQLLRSILIALSIGQVRQNRWWGIMA